MKDKEFLGWIHERLQHIHGETPNFDYMHKLRSIIETTPADQETPNMATRVTRIRYGIVCKPLEGDYILRDYHSAEARQRYAVVAMEDGLKVVSQFEDEEPK
ncbi:MAG: hypothetical protein V3W52_17095 [Syntrophobacteria bacterium]